MQAHLLVHYIKSDMEKPEFYNIKKFKEGFTYCDKDVFLWTRTSSYSRDDDGDAKDDEGEETEDAQGDAEEGEEDTEKEGGMNEME